MKIQADGMHFKELNEQIRAAADREIEISGCMGQRYIATGLGGKKITIHGIPGNALGAYLDGSEITVLGNVQDATGDTMNAGSIFIHGNAGDATGYAMRGGSIFVRDSTGYRAGIHMKAYQEKVPVLVIGGTAGSFLGEYQAGGLIIVLGRGADGKPPVGNFCGTGMHGGRIFLRCDAAPEGLPAQVAVQPAAEEELAEIRPYIEEFCTKFDEDVADIISKTFYILTPNTKNPYKRLYTGN